METYLSKFSAIHNVVGTENDPCVRLSKLALKIHLSQWAHADQILEAVKKIVDKNNELRGELERLSDALKEA